VVDVWQLSGTVTDAVNSVVGEPVWFGGVFASAPLASVAADGTFVITITWSPTQSGEATAQTEDACGMFSNVAVYWVFV
jgi:hypothetical protein